MNESRPRLLGVGLDDSKGHVRITKGPDYLLEGGSQETHEKMQEIVVKTDEALKKRGHTIKSASPERLSDTMDEVVERLTKS